MTRPYHSTSEACSASPLDRTFPGNLTVNRPSPSFKPNFNRRKSKRWVDVQVAKYDGDDWGEYPYDNDDSSKVDQFDPTVLYPLNQPSHSHSTVNKRASLDLTSHSCHLSSSNSNLQPLNQFTPTSFHSRSGSSSNLSLDSPSQSTDHPHCHHTRQAASLSGAQLNRPRLYDLPSSNDIPLISRHLGKSPFYDINSNPSSPLTKSLTTPDLPLASSTSIISTLPDTLTFPFSRCHPTPSTFSLSSSSSPSCLLSSSTCSILTKTTSLLTSATLVPPSSHSITPGSLTTSSTSHSSLSSSCYSQLIPSTNDIHDTSRVTTSINHLQPPSANSLIKPSSPQISSLTPTTTSTNKTKVTIPKLLTNTPSPDSQSNVNMEHNDHHYSSTTISISTSTLPAPLSPSSTLSNSSSSLLSKRTDAPPLSPLNSNSSHSPQFSTLLISSKLRPQLNSNESLADSATPVSERSTNVADLPSSLPCHSSVMDHSNAPSTSPSSSSTGDEVSSPASQISPCFDLESTSIVTASRVYLKSFNNEMSVNRASIDATVASRTSMKSPSLLPLKCTDPSLPHANDTTSPRDNLSTLTQPHANTLSMSLPKKSCTSSTTSQVPSVLCTSTITSERLDSWRMQSHSPLGSESGSNYSLSLPSMDTGDSSLSEVFSVILAINSSETPSQTLCEPTPNHDKLTADTSPLNNASSSGETSELPSLDVSVKEVNSTFPDTNLVQSGSTEALNVNFNTMSPNTNSSILSTPSDLVGEFDFDGIFDANQLDRAISESMETDSISQVCLGGSQEMTGDQGLTLHSNDSKSPESDVRNSGDTIIGNDFDGKSTCSLEKSPLTLSLKNITLEDGTAHVMSTPSGENYAIRISLSRPQSTTPNSTFGSVREMALLTQQSLSLSDTDVDNENDKRGTEKLLRGDSMCLDSPLSSPVNIKANGRVTVRQSLALEESLNKPLPDLQVARSPTCMPVSPFGWSPTEMAHGMNTLDKKTNYGRRSSRLSLNLKLLGISNYDEDDRKENRYRHSMAVIHTPRPISQHINGQMSNRSSLSGKVRVCELTQEWEKRTSRRVSGGTGMEIQCVEHDSNTQTSGYEQLNGLSGEDIRSAKKLQGNIISTSLVTETKGEIMSVNGAKGENIIPDDVLSPKSGNFNMDLASTLFNPLSISLDKDSRCKTGRSGYSVQKESLVGSEVLTRGGDKVELRVNGSERRVGMIETLVPPTPPPKDVMKGGGNFMIDDGRVQCMKNGEKAGKDDNEIRGKVQGENEGKGEAVISLEDSKYSRSVSACGTISSRSTIIHTTGAGNDDCMEVKGGGEESRGGVRRKEEDDEGNCYYGGYRVSLNEPTGFARKLSRLGRDMCLPIQQRTIETYQYTNGNGNVNGMSKSGRSSSRRTLSSLITATEVGSGDKGSKRYSQPATCGWFSGVTPTNRSTVFELAGTEAMGGEVQAGGTHGLTQMKGNEGVAAIGNGKGGKGEDDGQFDIMRRFSWVKSMTTTSTELTITSGVEGAGEKGVKEGRGTKRTSKIDVSSDKILVPGLGSETMEYDYSVTRGGMMGIGEMGGGIQSKFQGGTGMGVGKEKLTEESFIRSSPVLTNHWRSQRMGKGGGVWGEGGDGREIYFGMEKVLAGEREEEVRPKYLKFGDIMAIDSATERIKALEEARKLIAEESNGLDVWSTYLKTGGPLLGDVATSGYVGGVEGGIVHDGMERSGGLGMMGGRISNSFMGASDCASANVTTNTWVMNSISENSEQSTTECYKVGGMGMNLNGGGGFACGMRTGTGMVMPERDAMINGLMNYTKDNREIWNELITGTGDAGLKGYRGPDDDMIKSFDDRGVNERGQGENNQGNFNLKFPRVFVPGQEMLYRQSTRQAQVQGPTLKMPLVEEAEAIKGGGENATNFKFTSKVKVPRNLKSPTMFSFTEQRKPGAVMNAPKLMGNMSVMKSKEFIQSAGNLGEKATSGAKEFYHRGRHRLRASVSSFSHKLTGKF